MGHVIQQKVKYVILNDVNQEIIGEYDYIQKVQFDGKESDNVFLLKKNKLFGFYDAEKNDGTGIKFSYTTHFYNDLAIVAEKKGDKIRYYLINKEFEIMANCTSGYDEIKWCKNGLLVTVLNNKYGILNRKGNKVLSCEYDEILNNEFITIFNNRYLALRKGDSIVLVDEDANTYPITKNNI